MQGQETLMIVQRFHDRRTGIAQVVTGAKAQGAVNLAVGANLPDIACESFAVIEAVADFITVKQAAEAVIKDFGKT